MSQSVLGSLAGGVVGIEGFVSSVAKILGALTENLGMFIGYCLGNCCPAYQLSIQRRPGREYPVIEPVQPGHR